jgi:hypothetical protein
MMVLAVAKAKGKNEQEEILQNKMYRKKGSREIPPHLQALLPNHLRAIQIMNVSLPYSFVHRINHLFTFNYVWND